MPCKCENLGSFQYVADQGRIIIYKFNHEKQKAFRLLFHPLFQIFNTQ